MTSSTSAPRGGMPGFTPRVRAVIVRQGAKNSPLKGRAVRSVEKLISLIRVIIIIMKILVKDKTYFPKGIQIKPFQEAAFLIYYPMK